LAIKVRFKKTAMRFKKEGVHFKNTAMHFIFGPVLFTKKGVRFRQKLHAFGENGHSSCAEGGVGETMRRSNAARMEDNIRERG